MERETMASQQTVKDYHLKFMMSTKERMKIASIKSKEINTVNLPKFTV